MDKPTIPDVIKRFAAYRAQHPTWGSLHIVLEDHNLSDSSVSYCLAWAKGQGDTEGAALADLLLRMSRSQRWRLSVKIVDAEVAAYRAAMAPEVELPTPQEPK